MVLSVCFWFAVALIAYHVAVYPVLVKWLAGRKQQSTPATAAVPVSSVPTVTMIVPAHNEERVIATKIADLAALDYPAGKLTCVLALDGCTDQTEARARRAIEDLHVAHIQIRKYERNIGKIGVLNDQIQQADSDIVALSDASAQVPADALRRAAIHFADPGVGVVTGSYSVADLDSAGEAAYWRYQSELRRAEAALGGPMGAHGAFYLFRRTAWSPLLPDTINDDFVLPMTIALKGLRGVYEPGIVARELEKSATRQDFRRRVRIGAGNLQQAVRLRRHADPRRGWSAFTFASGKGLRGILPFLFLIVFFTSFTLALGGSAFFGGITIVEILMLMVAWWGAQMKWLGTSRLGNALVYMLQGYLALTVGAITVVTGRSGAVWRYSKGIQPSG